MKTFGILSVAGLICLTVNDEAFALGVVLVTAIYFGVKALKAVVDAAESRHED